MDKETPSAVRKPNPLASLRLIVWLLIIFTVLCLIGAIVPQRPGVPWIPDIAVFQRLAAESKVSAETGRADLPFVLWLINMFNPYNVFRSVPFLVVMIFMMVNMAACSIDRLVKLLREFRAPMLRLGKAREADFKSVWRIILADKNQDNLIQSIRRQGALRDALAMLLLFGPLWPIALVLRLGAIWDGLILLLLFSFSYPIFRFLVKENVRVEKDGEIAYYAFERGRLGRFGVYVIHLSVIVLAIGAMIGVLFSERGVINLYEGGSTSTFVDNRTGRIIDMGFEATCDRFEVEYYPNTRDVKEYTSYLTVNRPGHEPEQVELQVNRPYKSPEGFTLYQNTYGELYLLSIHDLVGDKTSYALMDLENGGPARVSGTEMVVYPMSFKEDQLYGLRLELAIQHGDGSIENSLVFLHYPDYDMRRPDARVRVTPRGLVTYTGIEVGRDPGVWVVYLSFVLIFIGLGMSFLFPHRRYYARLDVDRLVLAGQTNKYADSFQERLGRLASGLGEVEGKS